MKQTYSTELNQDGAKKLREFLKLHGIHYESSGTFGGLVYFQLSLSLNEKDQVNAFIDSL